MPVPEKYRGMVRSMVSQYCDIKKYGKDGRMDDKTIDGIASCPKARQVFYAWANKHGMKLSEEELLDLAVDFIMTTDKKE